MILPPTSARDDLDSSVAAALAATPDATPDATLAAQSRTVVEDLVDLATGPRSRERTAVILVRHDRTDRTTTSLDRATLHARALEVAAALRRFAGPGDRALILFPTSLEAVVALVACFYAGVVAVVVPTPEDGRGQEEHVRAVTADALPAAVLTRVALGLLAGSGVTDSLPVVDVDLDRAAEPRPPAEDIVRRPDPSDLAFLQYTSGSTGSPRGVMVTHGALADNIRAIRLAAGGVPGEVFCGWLPLHHDMGLVGQLLVPLAGDGTAVLMRPGDFVRHPVRWLQSMTTHRAAFTAAPDFAYELCARAITDRALAGVDLSGLRVALDGAEPVRASTLAAVQARLASVGLRPGVVKPSYGLAETTLFATGTPAGEAPRVLGVDRRALEAGRLEPAAIDGPGGDPLELVSCGIPTTSRVLIVDPATGQPLPEAAVGEIWLSGPSLARGYWGRPEESGRVFAARTADGDGPWLRTGDLGALLDGWCYVTGRIKETVVIHGRTSYPFDVEAAAREAHPSTQGLSGVLLAVATPRGEAAVLLHEVRPRPTDEATIATIVDALATRVRESCGLVLADIGLLRVGTIKRTTSGKVRRIAMREALLNGELDVLSERWSPALKAALAVRAAVPPPRREKGE